MVFLEFKGCLPKMPELGNELFRDAQVKLFDILSYLPLRTTNPTPHPLTKKNPTNPLRSGACR